MGARTTGRLRRSAVALAVAVASVVVVSGHGTAHAASATGGAALPAAWELCILESLGAPVTATDVADLDVWQVGEGGSTQNSNTFNPYNTRRTTDVSGAGLPAVMASDGFPAFANWPAGCAATVATIVQSNMAAIRTALVAGGQSPASAFLTTVDQTPWCAPDAGVPCYSTLIALGLQVTGTSRAMTLLSDTSSEVTAYARAAGQLVSLEGTLGAQQGDLTAAKAADVAAQQVVQGARQALQTLAVYDYTSNPSLDRIASLDQFEAPTQGDQLRQFYERVDLTREVRQLAQAQTVLHDAEAHTAAVEGDIAATKQAISATQSDELRSLSRLGADVSTLHGAGACPTVPPVPADPSVAVPAVAGVSGCLTSLGT